MPQAAFAALCASAGKETQGEDRTHGAPPHFGTPSVFGSLGGVASGAFHGASTVYAGACCLHCTWYIMHGVEHPKTYEQSTWPGVGTLSLPQSLIFGCDPDFLACH